MPSSYTPLFVGTSHIHEATVTSTNAYLLELVSKSRPPEGMVVSADYQTAGRGQIGREWDSEAGENILMSALLYPTFLLPRHMFYLNIIASLAAKSMIESYLPSADIDIKWPNDIYCNGKKICGILIQNSIEKGYLKNAIIGIGVNVNQKHFPIPNATSFWKESTKSFHIKEVRDHLCGALEQYYMILRSKNYKNLHDLYMEALYLKDTSALYEYIDTKSRFYGTIVGVDDSGNLLMSISGEERVIRMNEIKYIYENS